MAAKGMIGDSRSKQTSFQPSWVTNSSKIAQDRVFRQQPCNDWPEASG
jgi:hypothetical protein